MNKNLLKRILIVVLFFFAFSLVSCGETPTIPEKHDVNYKIEFEGLNDKNKSFITLSNDLKESGIVSKDDIKHSFSLNVSEGLNIDNLRITCNNKPIKYQKEALDTAGEKYSAYNIYTEPVQNNGIDDLNYKIDLSYCTFNTYEVKFDLNQPTSELKAKYMIEYDINKYIQNDNDLYQLDDNNLILNDLPSNKNITLPAGTTLLLFIPEEWKSDEIKLNYIDSYDHINVTRNINLIDAWDNSKKLIYKDVIKDKNGNVLSEIPYEVAGVRKFNTDGSIEILNFTPDTPKIEIPKKDGIFNIVALDAYFASSDYNFNMYVDDPKALELRTDGEDTIMTIDYKDNGVIKTLYHFSYGEGSIVNQIDYQAFPMRFRDSRNPNQYLYNGYIARRIDKASYTPEIIKDLSFELYGDDFSEGPKLTIPHEDLIFSEVMNGIESFVLFKLTPEMIQPFVEEIIVDGEFNYETNKPDKIKITSGTLFIAPKLANYDKVAKVSWECEGEVNGKDLPINTNVFEINRFFDNTITDETIYDTNMPILTYDKDGNVVAYFDKNIINNLSLDYSFEGENRDDINAYYYPRLRNIYLDFGSIENSISIRVEENPENSYHGTVALKKYFSNNELHLKASYANERFNAYLSLDFTSLLDNPNFDFYFAYGPLRVEPAKFKKLTTETISELNNIKYRPMDENPDSIFAYYLKPKEGVDANNMLVNLTFDIDYNGEKIPAFYSLLLNNIFGENWCYDDCSIYYIDTINSPIYIYEPGQVVKANLKIN